jgi:hypothetical protein
MKKKFKVTILFLLFFFITVPSAMAAVGCTLNDPDRDIRRLFPESTGYRTVFITIEEKGGESLKKEIEDLLGDTFDPVYETIDVPYACYIILKGKEVIGRVHGVNQKGMYGGMQLILATDLKGKIISFYYQKISSPEARKFKNKSFTSQFKGLTLKDFYFHDGQIQAEDLEAKISLIKDPSEKSNEDFLYTLRGLKKNLILLNVFYLNKDIEKNVTLNKGKISDE